VLARSVRDLHACALRHARTREAAPAGSSACWSTSLRARCLARLTLPYPNATPGTLAAPGRRHRYVYAAAAREPGANSPQQALVRVDTATGATAVWRPGPSWYVGEPVLVPKAPPGAATGPRSEEPAEGAAWLLAMCYDAAARASCCAVLDAGDVAAGPVARLPLRAPLPHGLHGAWSSECYAPLE